ncbi:MAG: polysaccharide biosynthesis/export family protein [Salinivirgaceae bacterium]|jgi:polysaccharide export outer membrane protein|nr:polysaccharide biosynthesis/export family protein [Salinivirgaceae bacterium]
MIRNTFFFLLFIVLLSTSCVRYKNIAYIQDRYKIDSVTMNLKIDVPEEIILEAGNNLYISLGGVEGNQLESFSKKSTGSLNYTELMLYFKGYLIGDDGFIELPVIGSIKVAGLSFKLAKKVIQERYAEFLKGVIVDVRLVSYSITILGEVKSPGTFVFYKRNINIFDVLSRCGELSNYGDARNILVIRNKGENSESVKVDLTHTDVFQNSHFWLEPNDVVYVKPLRAKMFSVNSPTINLFFSTVSLLIVLLTFSKVQ